MTRPNSEPASDDRPARRGPKPVAADETRRRLVEGLADSIREKGLAETQLSDIVRHARASRRTFYLHFADKDACFIELTKLLTAEILQRVTEAVDPTAAWTAQIDQTIDEYMSVLAEEPAMALTYSSPSLGAHVVRAQRDGIERFAQFIVDVVARPPFRDAGIAPIAIEDAYLLVSGLNQTVMRASDHGDDILALTPGFKLTLKALIATPTRQPGVATQRRRRAS